MKDFARLCAPLNRATQKDSAYKTGSITGEAFEAFKNLKTIRKLKEEWAQFSHKSTILFHALLYASKQ